MRTFPIAKILGRATDLLPPGGYDKLAPGARQAILRAAWATAEVDGPATPEETDELARLAQLFALPADSPEWGPGRAGQAAAVSALAAAAEDATFRRLAYAAAFVTGMHDGAIGEPERRLLDQYAEALGIQSGPRGELEQDLRSVLYEELLDTALANGDISPREKKLLDAMRRLLGVDAGVAARMESELRAKRGAPPA